jgi:hypothetical protein
MKIEFSRQIIRKNPEISNSMKIHPVATELFPADGRTDKKKLTVASRYLAAAPKNPKGTKDELTPTRLSVCFLHSVCTHALRGSTP